MPIEDLLHQAERCGRKAALLEAAAILIAAAKAAHTPSLTFMLSDLAAQIMALPAEPPAPLTESPATLDRPAVPSFDPPPEPEDPEPFDEFTGPQVCS